LAAAARSQSTAAVAKAKEAAGATDFFAALKAGDMAVLAAKMGPYGRTLLSTLTWIKDLLLEKLGELAASVHLPLPPVRISARLAGRSLLLFWGEVGVCRHVQLGWCPWLTENSGFTAHL
jgi:hypothetical protein